MERKQGADREAEHTKRQGGGAEEAPKIPEQLAAGLQQRWQLSCALSAG
jgi:ABC-type polar amino acid transport system ATPase subunit